MHEKTKNLQTGPGVFHWLDPSQLVPDLPCFDGGGRAGKERRGQISGGVGDVGEEWGKMGQNSGRE